MMTTPSKPALITTVDRQQVAGWRGLRLGWRVQELGDAYGLHLRESVAVFDVDLSVVENVYAVRRHLEQLGPVQPIFLIDSSKRIERVNAEVLGGKVCLDRECSDAELSDALESMLPEKIETMASRLFLQDIAGGLDNAFEDFRQGKRLNNAMLDSTVSATIEGLEQDFSSWMNSVRQHHEGTFQHCMLVMGFAAGFGLSLGMRRSDCEALTIAALVHDIGKMDVPLDILEKPGILTQEERAIILRHPSAGYAYLKSKSELSEDILHAVRHHHEFLDGSGYPYRLSGSAIPDMTRILTICDIAAALSERRSYKPPMSNEAMLEKLGQMAAAGKLDIDIVRAFGKAMPSFSWSVAA